MNIKESTRIGIKHEFIVITAFFLPKIVRIAVPDLVYNSTKEA
jgi:hypothetical protein